MGRYALKNVQQKDGRLYYRRKVAGKDQYLRLPDADDPTSPKRIRRRRTRPDRDEPARGSIAALVAAYRASSDFRTIPSPTTRANDSRYLDMIALEHGHRSVAGVRPFHVRTIRDRMQDKPGKANNWLRVFRSLMSYRGRERLARRQSRRRHQGAEAR
jgi:hypothetical protein